MLDLSRKRIAGSCTPTIISVRPGLGWVVLIACGMQDYEVSLDGLKCEFGYDQEKLKITYSIVFLRESPRVAVTRDCLDERSRFILGPSESKTAARL